MGWDDFRLDAPRSRRASSSIARRSSDAASNAHGSGPHISRPQLHVSPSGISRQWPQQFCSHVLLWLNTPIVMVSASGAQQRAVRGPLQHVPASHNVVTHGTCGTYTCSNRPGRRCTTGSMVHCREHGRWPLPRPSVPQSRRPQVFASWWSEDGVLEESTRSAALAVLDKGVLCIDLRHPQQTNGLWSIARRPCAEMWSCRGIPGDPARRAADNARTVFKNLFVPGASPMPARGCSCKLCTPNHATTLGHVSHQYTVCMYHRHQLAPFTRLSSFQCSPARRRWVSHCRSV